MPTNRYACVTVPVCKFHAKHSEISMSLLFTAVLCRRSCTCSKTWIWSRAQAATPPPSPLPTAPATPWPPSPATGGLTPRPRNSSWRTLTSRSPSMTRLSTPPRSSETRGSTLPPLPRRCSCPCPVWSVWTWRERRCLLRIWSSLLPPGAPSPCRSRSSREVRVRPRLFWAAPHRVTAWAPPAPWGSPRFWKTAQQPKRSSRRSTLPHPAHGRYGAASWEGHPASGQPRSRRSSAPPAGERSCSPVTEGSSWHLMTPAAAMVGC